MSEAPRYLVGDSIATVKMRSADGRLVDYAHQSLAGRAIVLFLAGDASAARNWAGLDALARELAGIETLCAAIIADPAKAPARPQVADFLIDPAGESAAAFGLVPPALVLIGPDLRVRELIPGEEFKTIAALARACHNATCVARVGAQAPVLMIEDVLEPELRERLITYWEAGDKRADLVSSTRQGSAAKAATIKRRDDVIVEDQAIVALLRQRMTRRVLGEIRKVHHMEIVGHEAFRIGCYEAADMGFFGRHRDNATPYTAHRRFALTLNLNQDYEGGELRFPEYGRMLYRPPAGGAVVFSCALLHEALPVAKGRRFVLLSFFFDREGAKQEREALARAAKTTPGS